VNTISMSSSSRGSIVNSGAPDPSVGAKTGRLGGRPTGRTDVQETCRSGRRSTTSSRSSAAAIRDSVSRLGLTPPASRRATAGCVLPMRVASSACVMPNFSLVPRTRSAKPNPSFALRYPRARPVVRARARFTSVQLRRSAIVFILSNVALVDAALHRSLRTIDLAPLAPLLFREHGEEDDPSPTRDVVRDAYRITSCAEVETELAELTPKLARVRLPEEGGPSPRASRRRTRHDRTPHPRAAQANPRLPARVPPHPKPPEVS